MPSRMSLGWRGLSWRSEVRVPWPPAEGVTARPTHDLSFAQVALLSVYLSSANPFSSVDAEGNEWNSAITYLVNPEWRQLCTWVP